MCVAQRLENSINAPQMVPQLCFRLIRVMTLDGFENRGVLTDQYVKDVRDGKAQLSNTIQVRSRPVEQLRDAGVAAGRDQFAMECLIEAVELLEISGDLGGSLQGQVLTQAGRSSRVDALRGLANGRALQSFTCELRLADIPQADLRDKGPQLGGDLDEPFRTQLNDRFADRGPTDAEVAGKFGFRKALPRRSV
jgi:hypothetical protein